MIASLPISGMPFFLLQLPWSDMCCNLELKLPSILVLFQLTKNIVWCLIINICCEKLKERNCQPNEKLKRFQGTIADHFIAKWSQPSKFLPEQVKISKLTIGDKARGFLPSRMQANVSIKDEKEFKTVVSKLSWQNNFRRASNGFQQISTTSCQLRVNHSIKSPQMFNFPASIDNA